MHPWGILEHLAPFNLVIKKCLKAVLRGGWPNSFGAKMEVQRGKRSSACSREESPSTMADRDPSPDSQNHADRALPLQLPITWNCNFSYKFSVLAKYNFHLTNQRWDHINRQSWLLRQCQQTTLQVGNSPLVLFYWVFGDCCTPQSKSVIVCLHEQPECLHRLQLWVSSDSVSWAHPAVHDPGFIRENKRFH